MKQIDRIRNMNAEELARAMMDLISWCDDCPCSLPCVELKRYGKNITCVDVLKAWLESEVEE